MVSKSEILTTIRQTPQSPGVLLVHISYELSKFSTILNFSKPEIFQFLLIFDFFSKLEFKKISLNILRLEFKKMSQNFVMEFC